ncbi:MAG: LTA synthase family protein [Bacteroidia bacterium]|nr:LTA synthase family protein [Bacteroidia bacterium]
MNLKLPHINILFKRLLLAYALYTFCRLVFFVTYIKIFVTKSTLSIIGAFLSGVWFDTSAIMYTFGLVVLMHILPINLRNNKTYQVIIKLIFLLAAALALVLNFIDVAYFNFSGKRSGFELIKMQSTQNISPITYLIDYWYLLLLITTVLYTLWRVYPEANLKTTSSQSSSIIVQFLAMILIGATTFIGARGSIGLKPLNTLDAAKYAGAELMPLTLNTPFQMLMTIEQTGVKEKNYMTDADAKNLFNPNKITLKNGEDIGKNVVLIILESIGKEYVGFYNNGKGYTPFIDSLMQHSEVYVNAYANGKRSIEGIPAIIASMPSWLQSDYINSFYQTNTLHSIGYYLAKQGYKTSFYHGGKNGTMSFDRFVANTQAGKYYGLNEYPNQKDFDGNWGIADEPYLQYVSNEMNNTNQPFFSTIFTLSSHHPYQLPAKYKNKFKGGPLPIHATVEYTDYAIQHFFETAKKQPWYSNTIFVFTADHSSENMLPYYLTSSGKYAVPLFVYNATPSTQDSLPKIVTNNIDHLGILPLILNKVSPKNTAYFSFACNGAIQFDGGIYQLIQYPYLLQFNGEKSIGFYNLNNDSLMKQNLIKMPDNDLLSSMELYLKANIQQYNNKLIYNQTY